MRQSSIHRSTTNRSLHTLAIVLLLFVAGCSSQQELMPTPVLFTDNRIDPLQQVVDSAQSTITPVFIASGRNLTGNSDPKKFYDNERNRVLRLAVANVEFGRDLSWSDLHATSTARDREHNPHIHTLTVEDFGPLWTTVPPPDLGFDRDFSAPKAPREPAKRFADKLNQQLASTQGDELYIFVHGFNTEFTHNLGIAAELWHYLGRQGAILSYAWPSKHALFDYGTDKANAEYATRLFRKLLAYLADNTDAASINIIAHSAGGPIVVNALKEIRLVGFQQSKKDIQQRFRIKNVVLAAPDMDFLQFINASLDGFDEVAQQVAIYASSEDDALSLSRWLFGSRRLGASADQLTSEEVRALKLVGRQLYAIDVWQAQQQHSSFLGHSYYHQNPWVSSDVALLLRYGLAPNERGLVQGSSGMWTFPKDYEAKLAQIVAH